ncbi:unnamed protein product [Arctia plantaginis]|uniref:FLYWCH-type domain-containing protein n=1 Tax=Arctia plantaginis TaxID=874455 RepID=A0A8S0ZUD5_ARCPL|nr:unnamed protein product [Arctia plantaginis]CAB3250371.1 unnamed protein product [Arctia plantaginis]
MCIVPVKDALFSISRFGKPKLVLGNQSFNIHKIIGPKSIWRCQKWRWGQCRTTITTLENCVIKMNKPHNHD